MASPIYYNGGYGPGHPGRRQFPVVKAGQIRWHPAGVSVPFTLALADLFRPV